MMKSLSNNTRRIALVIMLLIWVVIMATCQGHLIGTDKDASSGPANPGNTAGTVITLSAEFIKKTNNLMSDCVVCYGDQNAGGIPTIGSPHITVLSVIPVDSMMVNANP